MRSSITAPGSHHLLMEKVKKSERGTKIGKFAGILLLLIGCGMVLCAAALIMTEGFRDYFFDALCWLFAMPGAALLLSGIRILKRKRKNGRIILAGFAFGIIGFGILVSHYHADVSDIKSSISVRTDFAGGTAASSADTAEVSAEDDRLHWYNTIEEAMQDASLVRDAKTYMSYNQLANLAGMIKSNGQVMAFYGIQNDDAHLAIYYCRVRNGQYSQPYRIDKPMCADNPAYHYDLDDSVCERIADQYASQAMAQKNKEIPFFWGCWKDRKELKSLTIDGQPVETITKLSDSNPYYFWMIRSDRIIPKLQTIDFSGFTYQQMTDVLNIKFSAK